jgi:hypothetical protein
VIGAACKGVLHHRETHQQHDENKAAAQCRLHDVVGELARHRHPGAEKPAQYQGPGGDQHHRPVIAVEAEIGDQRHPGHGGRRERDASYARRHRRIIDRHREQSAQTEDPGNRHVGQVGVPPVEVEIGEQEDHQPGGQQHFRARPPDPFIAGRHADKLGEKAEIHRNIGQHRPGKRCGCRKHRGALDHEQDGQEHRQQTCDPQHDAAVQRVGVDRVLVGFGLPQVDLRQVGGGQFRNECDDGARVEGDAKDIVLAAFHLVERETLARGDAENPRRPEVWPQKA